MVVSTLSPFKVGAHFYVVTHNTRIGTWCALFRFSCFRDKVATLSSLGSYVSLTHLVPEVVSRVATGAEVVRLFLYSYVSLFVAELCPCYLFILAWWRF